MTEILLTLASQFSEFLKQHSEAFVTGIGIYLAFSQSSKDKQTENYLHLKESFRSLWGSLTALPEENEVLMSKDIKDFKKEDEAHEQVKLLVFQIIDLFNDVYFYYERSGQNIDKSDWHNKMTFVFSKKLFITGFKKHGFNYNKNYKIYVEKIIKEAELQQTMNSDEHSENSDQ